MDVRNEFTYVCGFLYRMFYCGYNCIKIKQTLKIKIYHRQIKIGRNKMLNGEILSQLVKE